MAKRLLVYNLLLIRKNRRCLAGSVRIGLEKSWDGFHHRLLEILQSFIVHPANGDRFPDQFFVFCIDEVDVYSALAVFTYVYLGGVTVAVT